MKVDKIIKLTFGNYKCVRRGDRTIAQMTSYFKQENLDEIFNRLGFSTLPDPVKSVLKKYGYTYDYKLGGWKTTTSGMVVLQDDDVDDQAKANNMSLTKAKTKAYSRSVMCLAEMYNAFASTVNMITSSLADLSHITIEEKTSLGRCLDTGYCDPNRK